MGYEGRCARLLECHRHGHHGRYEHDALPVDGLVGRLDVAEAPRYDHKQRRCHDSRHRRDGNELEHHGRYHQQHYYGGHRRLVVESNLRGLLLRLPEHHPVGLVVVELCDVAPLALHEQHVARLQFHLRQVVHYVVIVALYAKHIDAVALSEARFAQWHPNDSRSRHEHNLGYADVVEVDAVVVQFFHSVLAGKLRHLGRVARQVYYVAGSQYALRRCKALRDVAYQSAPVRAFVANLENRQSVASGQVKLGHAFAGYCRVLLYSVAPQGVAQVVFAYQVVESLAPAGVVLAAAFLLV